MSETFAHKAPSIMRALMADFSAWGVEDAAACLGNAGGETGGFKHLQELKPAVPGSRGGYGWFQWTGPRRRAYESWCAQRNLDPSSDEANYGFLSRELRTSERKTVTAVAAAEGLAAKVIAFERSFERAGIPHHESRIRWAQLALDSYRAQEAPEESVALADPEPVPEPTPEPTPHGVKPEEGPAVAVTKPSLWRRARAWIGVGSTSGLGVLTYLTDWKVIAAIGGLVLLTAVLFVLFMGPSRVREWIARQVRACCP